MTAKRKILIIDDNDALTSLAGLDNLIRVQSKVEVYQNPLLSSCNGLRRLLDAVDDGAAGPGPGTAGIPSVRFQSRKGKERMPVTSVRLTGSAGMHSGIARSKRSELPVRSSRFGVTVPEPP